jgi:arsenate reductase
MPDHLHLIATFNLDRGLAKTVRAWKSFQARQLGIPWQSGFFEHRLRNQVEFDEKMDYVRWNPVRKGLVERPGDWPYVLDRTRLGRDASPYPAATGQPLSSGRANPPGEPRNVRKLNILFLCTGNSCRSKMAEGWTRALKGDQIEAYSAGIETHGLNPRAVNVMAEAGVDISGHRSKTVAELAVGKFDYVVTVCDHAHESCPLFPAKTKVVHAGFDDPPRLAKEAKTEEEALAHYRRVRNEIKAFVETLPEGLKTI